MRNLVSSFLLVFSLLLASDVLAQEKPSVPKRQGPPKQAVAQKLDPAGIARKYLANNCVVSLKVYSVDPADQSVTSEGDATGFLIAHQGTSYVFTNAHVVGIGTDTWALFDHDILPQELRVEKRDNAFDGTLLTFVDKTFRAPCAIPLGDSDTLSMGDEVFTLCNHPFLRFAFSKGYVMKKDVVVISLEEKLTGITSITSIRLGTIYSELNLNKGSSGGPLLNTKGEVVGVNQAVSSDLMNPSSLSIPINLIKKGLLGTTKSGNITHGFINVAAVDSKRFSPLDKYASGISTRFRNGPIVIFVPTSAEHAGIEKDDMIVAVNDTPTPTANDLYTLMLFTLQPGAVAKVTVLREEDHVGVKEWAYKDIDVTVEEFRATFR